MARKKQNQDTEAQAAPAVDIASLTPAQLKKLQEQLKERNKELKGKKDERFAIIDALLQEKDDDGNFVHSTRDILGKLEEAGLVDNTAPNYDTNEIKKIQSRKQFLEKKRDEAGELVFPEGTFGYKASERVGFGMRAATVVKFFEDEEQLATLTDDQRDIIVKALS
jgi:hypothetical protein